MLAACGRCATVRAAPAAARTDHVDGISDQSLPAWQGSFASSPFAGLLRSEWAGPAPARIKLARYVVQWNAMSEPSTGPDAAGDYRERFEAWVADIGALGLTPVLSLTSYDGVRPASLAEYERALQALLAAAAGAGAPVTYVEAWNEPNNQGREDPATAAAYADGADALCRARGDCEVIAGDLEDSSGAVAYERAYERGLTFAPRIWGVHPYAAVKAHDDANVRALVAQLPGGGARAQLWFTEVGAYYCVHGVVRGEAAQAADASYLVRGLLADAAVAPAHAIYYGLLYKDGLQASCSAGGGDDVELFGAAAEPRAAATIVLGPSVAPTGAGLADPGASVNPARPGASPNPGNLAFGPDPAAAAL
ncbi:MAG TPA: hypothetical protein VF380_00900, partial [Solirubrobacteraceae bacterium]